MVSKLSGSQTPRAPRAAQASKASAPKAATSKAAAPKAAEKPVTAAQVVQSRELATRYTLDTNNLPFRSTEEVLEYLHHNLDALQGKGPADAKTRERIPANLHFALAELENRLPFGELREQLYAARQAVSQGESVAKPAQSMAARAIAAFEKSQHIDPASTKWAPAVFEPAAQLGRFRGPLEQLSFSLGRVYMPGLDAPDFRQKMPNLLAVMDGELSKVTLPTDPTAKQVFGRSVNELKALVKDLMRTAEGVERPDIVASGTKVLEALDKFGAAAAT